MRAINLIVFGFVIGFITFICSSSGATEKTRNKRITSRPVIGIIKHPKFDEAGCSLQLPRDNKRGNERYIFRSNMADDAQMNIDGADIDLKVVNRQEPNDNPKKGDHSIWNYAAGDLRVRVEYIVSGLCDPKDESCEVIYYDAIITAPRGGSKQRLRAVGLCGS